MVFIEKLTAPKFMAIGREAGILNVRALPYDVLSSAPNETEFTLTIKNGVVRIAWDSANPGHQMIVYLLPLMLMSVLITIAMTVILMRHIMHKARINDEHMFLLDQARLKLITSEKRFRDVSETTSDWLWETDLSLRIIWLSERFSTVTGYDNSEWTGRRLDELFPSTKDAFKDCLNREELTGQFSFKNCPYLNSQYSTAYCTLLANRCYSRCGHRCDAGSGSDKTRPVSVTP